MAEFISVLEPYDPAVRRFYDKIDNDLLQSQENFFVGYEGKKTVTIGILFVNGATAGIFSLLTNDNSRGKDPKTYEIRRGLPSRPPSPYGLRRDK